MPDCRQSRVSRLRLPNARRGRSLFWWEAPAIWKWLPTRDQRRKRWAAGRARQWNSSFTECSRANARACIYQRSNRDGVAALQRRKSGVAILADQYRLGAIACQPALNHLIGVFGDGKGASAVRESQAAAKHTVDYRRSRYLRKSPSGLAGS